MKKVKRGFTLVELLIVIAIIGILAAVIAPNAFKAIDKSKVASVESNFKEIKTAALSYFADTSAWPVTATGGAELVKDNTTTPIPGWNGPYIDKFPTTTPWGATSTFVYTNANNAGAANTPTGALIGHNCKFITLALVPTAAAQQLERDLDGATTVIGTINDTGMVRWAATTTGTTATVYLVISEQ